MGTKLVFGRRDDVGPHLGCADDDGAVGLLYATVLDPEIGRELVDGGDGRIKGEVGVRGELQQKSVGSHDVDAVGTTGRHEVDHGGSGDGGRGGQGLLDEGGIERVGFPVETTPEANRLAEIDGVHLMDQGAGR